jgi:hypothetical protein
MIQKAAEPVKKICGKSRKGRTGSGLSAKTSAPGGDFSECRLRAIASEGEARAARANRPAAPESTLERLTHCDARLINAGWNISRRIIWGFASAIRIEVDLQKQGALGLAGLSSKL